MLMFVSEDTRETQAIQTSLTLPGTGVTPKVPTVLVHYQSWSWETQGNQRWFVKHHTAS